MGSLFSNLCGRRNTQSDQENLLDEAQTNQTRYDSTIDVEDLSARIESVYITQDFESAIRKEYESTSNHEAATQSHDVQRVLVIKHFDKLPKKNKGLPEAFKYFDRVIFAAPASRINVNGPISGQNKFEFLQLFNIEPSPFATISCIQFGKQWGDISKWSPDGKGGVLVAMIKMRTHATVFWDDKDTIDMTQVKDTAEKLKFEREDEKDQQNDEIELTWEQFREHIEDAVITTEKEERLWCEIWKMYRLLAKNKELINNVRRYNLDGSNNESAVSDEDVRKHIWDFKNVKLTLYDYDDSIQGANRYDLTMDENGNDVKIKTIWIKLNERHFNQISKKVNDFKVLCLTLTLIHEKLGHIKPRTTTKLNYRLSGENGYIGCPKEGGFELETDTCKYVLFFAASYGTRLGDTNENSSYMFNDSDKVTHFFENLRRDPANCSLDLSGMADEDTAAAWYPGLAQGRPRKLAAPIATDDDDNESYQAKNHTRLPPKEVVQFAYQPSNKVCCEIFLDEEALKAYGLSGKPRYSTMGSLTNQITKQEKDAYFEELARKNNLLNKKHQKQSWWNK